MADINKHEVDIQNLFKQNELDLNSIKELYKRIEELGIKITQIKYIDTSLSKKLQAECEELIKELNNEFDNIVKDYESLKRVIIDENVQLQLNDKIDKTKTDLTNDINEISTQLDNTVSFKKMKLDELNDDNSGIFNDICEEMKSNIKLNGIGNNNIISIPNGIYKFNESINIPSYIKLKPIGTVIFEFTGNGKFINITPEDDLKFNKQMYFRGSLIDGSNGGLIISANNKSDTIGITVGDINSANQMSRYNLNDIAIYGFYKGLVLKMKNNYICEYSRLHLEENTINVSIGDGEVCVNSGENINFKNCVFAGAKKSIYFNNDADSYVGVYFNNCSFDFNDTVLEISSAYNYSGEINFCDCHIEQNKCIVNNLANESNQYYIPPGIKFRNCVFIEDFYVYFKGSKMFIDIDTLRIQTAKRVTDVTNSFVASNFEKIIITAKNIKFSNNSNSIATFFNNSIYPYSSFESGDLLSGSLTGYGNNSQSGVTQASVENKMLKITGNGTGSWIMFNSTIPLSVSYGETIMLGIKWKTSDTTVNLKVNFLCYDEDDNLIETFSSGDYQWNGTDGNVLIHPAKYIYTINKNNIRKFKFKFSFANFTSVEISDVICNIV